MIRAARFAAIAVTAFTLPLFAVTQRPLIVTSQDHSLVNSDDCDHFQTRTMTSFPTQLTLIKYSGSIAGAGYNFGFGAYTLPDSVPVVLGSAHRSTRSGPRHRETRAAHRWPGSSALEVGQTPPHCP